MKPALIIFLVAIAMAALLSPLASSLPDGLETVTEALGFGDTAGGQPQVPALLPDYTIPPLGDTPLSTSLAGLIGTTVCFILPFGFYLLWKK